MQIPRYGMDALFAPYLETIDAHSKIVDFAELVGYFGHGGVRRALVEELLIISILHYS